MRLNFEYKGCTRQATSKMIRSLCIDSIQLAKNIAQISDDIRKKILFSL